MPIDVAAEVIANRQLSSDYNVLALAAPAIAAASASGQFVMIKANGSNDPLLRRPFSVFEILRADDGTAIGLSIFSKRIGVSTQRLYDARPGQPIACLGPLGRPFTIVEPPADAWMVAGGVGLAPFATLADSLRAGGVRSTLFYGARRAAELFYLEFFRQRGVELVVTTEDGTAGERGRVVEPLDRALASRLTRAAVKIYACGPEGMLAATARTASRYARPCQVSVERTMGCGVGGGYGCVVPVRDEPGGVHQVRSRP